jgi:hypothetical protein
MSQAGTKYKTKEINDAATQTHDAKSNAISNLDEIPDTRDLNGEPPKAIT